MPDALVATWRAPRRPRPCRCARWSAHARTSVVKGSLTSSHLFHSPRDRMPGIGCAYQEGVSCRTQGRMPAKTTQPACSLDAPGHAQGGPAREKQRALPVLDLLVRSVLSNGIDGGQAGIIVLAPLIRLDDEGEDALHLGHPGFEAHRLAPMQGRWRGQRGRRLVGRRSAH